VSLLMVTPRPVSLTLSLHDALPIYAADETFPGGRPERQPEPRRNDDGTGDGVARLGLQVAEGHQPAERGAEQQLRAVGPEADDATERLEVAQQLAEAR